MRYHLALTACAHFFFTSLHNSMTCPQLTSRLFDSWCGWYNDHFGHTMEQQSHCAHTSFFRLDCATKVCLVSGCRQFHVSVAICSHFVQYPMNFFSMFFAMPVGQASNPGPNSQTVKIAIANPTALHKKPVDCSNLMPMLLSPLKQVQQLSFRKKFQQT